VKNINNLEQDELIDKLLDGNLYENFVNMNPGQIKKIEWKAYQEKCNNKLDEILDKEETKSIFMPRIQALIDHQLNNYQIAEIMKNCAIQSGIFWKDPTSTIVSIAREFRKIWINKGHESMTYDNLKKCIKKRFGDQFEQFVDWYPEQYIREDFAYKWWFMTIPKGTKDKNWYLLDVFKKFKVSVEQDVLQNQEIHGNIKWIMHHILLNLKVISSYISVAEEDDKVVLMQLFEERNKLYESVKKSWKEKIEKGSIKIVENTQNVLWETL